MIYLDNSATSYPKPQCVLKSIMDAYEKFGANAGRSAYGMAINTTEQIYLCREKIAKFFGANKVENVIFTYNCTTALNMAIKGVSHKNAHYIISDLEHNAVVRPLERMKQMGMCDYSVAKVSTDDFQTIKNFKKNIRENTVAIICTGASNVFGIIPPYRLLSNLAHKNNLLFIMDCAQVGGVIPINMTSDGIDILCCAGHKGLMGPTGTGLMIINNDNISLNSLIEGGTGSNSLNPNQPDFSPDKFESGTPNVQGILGLSTAIDFINDISLNKIYKHEMYLLRYLQKNLQKIDGIYLYTDLFSYKQNLVPILSFNIKNLHSEEVAKQFGDYNIAVRAGLHCAPLAHQKIGTIESGTVRISPSIFTKKSDIDFLINSIIKNCKI